MTDLLRIPKNSAALPLFWQASIAGEAIDMTGATDPVFSMRSINGGARKVDEASAAIADGSYTVFGDGETGTVAYAPTDGVLIYDWATADLDTAGDYLTQFEVTKGGKQMVCPGPRVRVFDVV